jgi:hypothetical protein
MSDARDVLWTKLLSGKVTEVYVSSSDFYDHLPQTLGLEPILFQPYLYDRAGNPRDADELSELASRISAEPWWIAGTGPWFWSSHFEERAEVILIILTGLGQRLPVASQNKISYGAGALWLYQRWRDRRRTAAGSVDLELPFLNANAGSLMEAMVEPRRQPMTVNGVNPLVDRYPEKTFVIRSREHLRDLRIVRAKRPPADRDRAAP